MAMALIAGLGLGFWIINDDVRDLFQKEPNGRGLGLHHGSWDKLVFLVALASLGGLSVVGPPLLLWQLRRTQRRWGAGRLLWFSQGMASWLLWPPVIYRKVSQDQRMGDTVSGVCYAYGTPLMALYVTSALLAGGWLRPRRRRRRPLSWQDRFGILLGLAWACTGLYVLFQLYRGDFGGR